jgi:hypothetical protein
VRRAVLAICAAGAVLLAATAPALGASRGVELVDNLPEAKNATAINFMQYGELDVMLVTGRFGLKTYSLAEPANPAPLDELTAEDLRLEGGAARRGQEPPPGPRRSP